MLFIKIFASDSSVHYVVFEQKRKENNTVETTVTPKKGNFQ